MDIVGDRIAGDPLELVRQVIRAHIRLFRQLIKSQVFLIVGMDIVGHGIDPFRDLVGYLSFLINIAALKFVQVVKKRGEKAVQDQFLWAGKFFGDGLPFGFVLKGNVGDLIDKPRQDT